MTKQHQILDRQRLYDGFFKLDKCTLQHTLFDGGWSEPIQRELFRRSDCVGVLLYDPRRDEVVLLEQFRVGAMVHTEQAFLVEIVAGGIEEGESKEDVAYREAYEEAGCQIEELVLINEFYTTPGCSSEFLSLFYGKVDTTNVGGVFGLKEEQEDILVKAISFTEVYQMLEQGQIKSAIPLVALQWLALNRHKLR